MEAERRVNADQAFALYDMGDMEVKDTGTWQDQGGDEWSMPVFIEGPDGEDGYGTSTKLTFVVRFVAGSAEVNEAYFAG